MKSSNIIASIVLLSILAGCSAPATATLKTAPTPTAVTQTETPIPTAVLLPTATATPRPHIKPGDSIGFIHGIAYIASHITDWAYPLSDQSLQALRDTGADWVSLNAFVTYYDDPQKSLEATIHAIQEAHRLGLNVLLRPNFEETDLQSYHDDIGYSEEQWQAWADRHTELLLPYAQIAQEYEVEIFAVGYEMRATEPEEAHWRAIIQKVRNIYSGPLTYSSLPNEEADVKWWDALDFIGVDGYYSLSNNPNPSEAELKSAWLPYLNKLEALSKRYSKQIIFTEIGYPSTTIAAKEPGNGSYGTIDLDLQSRLYKVLFEVIQDRPWINGVFMWAWDETPYQGGSCDFEHSPKGKPSENVMRAFFGAPAVSLPVPDPNLPVFEVSQINAYSIFDDSFYPLMDPNWSWNTKYEIKTTPEPFGKNALQVTMTNNAGLMFYLGNLDPSPYQWLEFYLYREDDQSIPLRIMVYRGERNILINRQIRSCWYAEGGVVPKNTWTRVLIPLEHLNVNQPILGITLVKWEDGDLKFWLDNIRLVGIKK